MFARNTFAGSRMSMSQSIIFNKEGQIHMLNWVAVYMHDDNMK